MDKISYFTKVLGINNRELLQKFSEESTIKEFKKGSSIIEKGEYHDFVYFLKEGILRGYAHNSEGKEITECFVYRYGQLAMGSYRLDDLPNISIMAIDHSVCLKVSKAKIQEWMDQYPDLVLVYNNLLAKETEEHQEIKHTLYMFQAKQRYAWFLKKYDNMINRVSHKFVASFLNMSPVTLSRLRGEIEEEKNGEL